MPKLIRGEDLNPAQRRHVLQAFIYRCTTENGYPTRNPCKARIPAIPDAQWLREHAFWFNNDGSPTNARGCNYAEPAYLAA